MIRMIKFALCAASVALMPLSASAFEIQGQNAELPKSAAEHLGIAPELLRPQFEGSSLAMPYASSGDAPGHVSDYGNAIAIPAPGISQPTPAWRSGPFFR